MKPPQKNRLCPYDHLALTKISYESESLDTCPRCGGLWCDDEDLAKIVANRTKQFLESEHSEIRAQEADAKVTKTSDATGMINCIVCHRTMTRVNYAYSSGILIDRCPIGHGVWLDKEEIQKIQVFVARWDSQKDRLEASYGALLKKVGEEAANDLDRTVIKSTTAVSRFARIANFFKKLVS